MSGRTKTTPPLPQTGPAKKEPDGIPKEPSGCYTGYMNILPTKDYSSLYSFNQLSLPMDVGVLIPKDDLVYLLVFVLK
jgi:hypothetical protein